MKRCLYPPVLLMPVTVFLFVQLAIGVHADTPVVHAVLFYSPNCGHCHKVITEDLPPLFEKYGDRLQIIGIDASDASGGALYNAAADKLGIPPENRGVPLLIVADIALIGSRDIPEQLPALIEQYLATGGIDWPDIPGLAEAIAQPETAQPGTAPDTATSPAATLTATSTVPAPTLVPTAVPTFTQLATTPTPGLLLAGGPADSSGPRFERDPVGNGLAGIVLTVMIAVFVLVMIRRPWRALVSGAVASDSSHGIAPVRTAAWAVPLLCLVGLGVAGYMAYVETRQVQAVCGPVGDCNSVQQSAYARLFGLLPIGVLGVFGYLAILAAWAVCRFGPATTRGWAALILWTMTAGGVLFSIYLTFLEPFVIGATCAWCLSSAVIMTLLLVLVTMDARTAQARARLIQAEADELAT